MQWNIAHSYKVLKHAVQHIQNMKTKSNKPDINRPYIG